MADSNVDLIVNELYTILSGVSEVDQVLKYEPRYLDRYTTVSIFWSGAEFEPAEISSHWANYRFIITVYIYMYDEKDVQEKQKDLGLSIMSALRSNPSLNNTCLYHFVESLENGFIGGDEQSIYATITITLIARKEEDV